MTTILTLDLTFQDPRYGNTITDWVMLNYTRDYSWYSASYFIGQTSGGDTQNMDSFSPTGIYLKEGGTSVCAILYKIACLDITKNLGDTGTATIWYGVMGPYPRPINATWTVTAIGYSSIWR
jgi:hypothetical protein